MACLAIPACDLIDVYALGVWLFLVPVLLGFMVAGGVTW